MLFFFFSIFGILIEGSALHIVLSSISDEHFWRYENINWSLQSKTIDSFNIIQPKLNQIKLNIYILHSSYINMGSVWGTFFKWLFYTDERNNT